MGCGTSVAANRRGPDDNDDDGSPNVVASGAGKRFNENVASWIDSYNDHLRNGSLDFQALTTNSIATTTSVGGSGVNGSASSFRSVAPSTTVSGCGVVRGAAAVGSIVKLRVADEQLLSTPAMSIPAVASAPRKRSSQDVLLLPPHGAVTADNGQRQSTTAEGNHSAATALVRQPLTATTLMMMTQYPTSSNRAADGSPQQQFEEASSPVHHPLAIGATAKAIHPNLSATGSHVSSSLRVAPSPLYHHHPVAVGGSTPRNSQQRSAAGTSNPSDQIETSWSRRIDSTSAAPANYSTQVSSAMFLPPSSLDGVVVPRSPRAQYLEGAPPARPNSGSGPGSAGSTSAQNSAIPIDEVVQLKTVIPKPSNPSSLVHDDDDEDCEDEEEAEDEDEDDEEAV
jgi:hypothetical protein